MPVCSMPHTSNSVAPSSWSGTIWLTVQGVRSHLKRCLADLTKHSRDLQPP